MSEMAGAAGIEPAFLDLESSVLPLYIMPLWLVWLGRHVFVAAKSYATAWRILRGGELLNEIGHAVFDLRNVALCGIHAVFELCNAFDLVDPVQQHLTEDPCRPLAKSCSLD